MTLPTAMVGLALLFADPPWKLESNEGGVTLESRPVAGSAYYEYRARGVAQVDAAALCDGVFEWGTRSTDHPHLQARTLLEDQGDTRLVQDHIAAPFIANRVLIFTSTKYRTPEGNCAIEFHAEKDKGPPAPPGWVRIEKLTGSWSFEPSGTATQVTYTFFVDPGGKVPPFFVHGSQRDATLRALKTSLTKGSKVEE